MYSSSSLKNGYVLKLFLCLILTLVFPIIKAQDDKPTTLKTIIIETTTELVTIITDIPQSDVEIALKHDYGRYTTMLFKYFNTHYENAENHERCFNDYTKCLITQGTMTPVCVINDPREIPYGYYTYNTYCEAYFDNCLRAMRKITMQLNLKLKTLSVSVYKISSKPLEPFPRYPKYKYIQELFV